MVSYKVKKYISLPENEHIIKKNAHEPIISEEEFNLAQDMLKLKTHKSHNKQTKDHLLSGLLYCPRCGNKYRYQKQTGGQCDSIYATFVVLSFLYLLKEKYLSSFLLLGIAFAFKLQFIFILPVYLFVYLKKKSFPFYYFFLIPIVNLIFSLPPLVIGRSLEKIMGIYIGQASQYSALSMHYPNVYSFFGKFQTNSGEVLNQTNFPIATIGIIFTFLLFILLAIWLFRKKKVLNKENLFLLTVWTTLILPFLLPHMHDRYGYLAGIFSILYALIYHKKYYVAIGYQILTIFLYIGGYNEIGNYILSIAHLILVMVFTYQVIVQFIKLTKQQTRERIEEK